MQNIRLVVLDYPKLTIKAPSTKKVLMDMIQSKQINFERTDMDYITLSNLDMISTHFLIYDTTDILNPKPVLAIRNCYQDRADKHNLKLPYNDYFHHFSSEQKERHLNFRKNKNCIVDCNAWFVDPKFSKSNSGLNLSDIAFFMVVSHILKRGFQHFIGTSNETYKASRWLEPVSAFDKDMIFNHPKVDGPHMIILCDQFNYDWYLKSWEKYEDLFRNRMIIAPKKNQTNENLYDDDELLRYAKSLSLQKTAA